MARAQVAGAGQVVIDWLEGAIKSLLPRPPEDARTAAARFSPGHECLRAIVGELQRAARAIDVCVFTITDDRIVEEILATHRRGVRVRIVTDDDKSLDLGSDVDRMSRAGIEVRMDATPDHMHHKFAIFDHERLVTGSYNWTRSAAEHNHENVVITDERALVVAFERTFDRLWDRFSAAARRG
jgi:phosphatidylserine/phosphatidylglycerophosphate/cardiolipin synthase-like enzyme